MFFRFSDFNTKNFNGFLNPVKELLERCSESPIVLDALSDVMLHYDDAECDGHCLLEDINDVLEDER